MLKNIKPRTYQETIFNTAVKNNCLVVLPTGLGKTTIALLLAAFRLEHYPHSKILVLAPTKPLAEQHLETFRKHILLPEEQISLFTGFVKPDKRAELWKTSKIIISTPQGIENDIVTKRIFLEEVSLLVVDEAHRAIKGYSYVFVANQYGLRAKHSKIIGLTASPGSDLSHIEEVCRNLAINELEVRTEEDEDIKPYVQEIDIKWIEINLPESFKKIRNYLETFVKKKLSEIKSLGYLQSSSIFHTKKSLLALQAELRGRISSGEKDFEILKSISLLAEVMKIQHLLELLESQGLESVNKYVDKLEQQAVSGTVKAVKNLVKDNHFKIAKSLLKNLIEKGVEHPKISVLDELLKKEVQKNKSIKIIIFTQFRNSVSQIKKLCNQIFLKNEVFIGQAKKEEKGLSQKEQKKTIDRFSKGEFNCLISTSVGEEGLDIPQVDLVVFFEPIPSAIRTIQRRGRTGRLEKGRVVVLMTKKTRDEVHRWSSHHKEKRMYRNLKKLQEKLSYSNHSIVRKNKNLKNFLPEENITIIIDHREKSSKVVKQLLKKRVNLDIQTMEVGDYLLSDEVVVEYKTKKDFVDSIIDGRLLQQAKNLTRYLKPLLIIEGEEDIYSQRNIHQDAIRGMLSVLAVSYRIPIIFTKNEIDTAALLRVIAKREQDPNKKQFQMHSAKPQTLREQQEYIIASLPGIGTSLAKPLLKKFKTVKKIVNAKEDSLKKISLIGPKKAKKIKGVIESEYKEY